MNSWFLVIPGHVLSVGVPSVYIDTGEGRRKGREGERGEGGGREGGREWGREGGGHINRSDLPYQHQLFLYC